MSTQRVQRETATSSAWVAGVPRTPDIYRVCAATGEAFAACAPRQERQLLAVLHHMKLYHMSLLVTRFIVGFKFIGLLSSSQPAMKRGLPLICAGRESDSWEARQLRI